MIVDVDPGLLSAYSYGSTGRGRRFIQLLKQGAPGARQFLEGPVVERSNARMARFNSAREKH